MGYSISVTFNNQEQCDKMSNFLLSQQIILDQLKENCLDGPLDSSHSNTPVDGLDLSYSPHNPNSLGFDGSRIPHYLWAICAWMAFQNDIKNNEGHYIFYYDDEKMYAQIGSTDLQTKHFIIDEQGLRVIRKNTDSLLLKTFKYLMKYDSYVEKEQELLEQLNKEWINYQLNETQKNKKSLSL